MAIAQSTAGTPPLALTFDYGQRTRKELARASSIADHFGSEHLVIDLDATRWGGSALTDESIDVPKVKATDGMASTTSQEDSPIPITYVPARNIIFLAVALGVAEAKSIDSVYIGVNSLDYSGYPDCRPEFIEAFRRVAQVGQKRGVEGSPIDICAPLISMTKQEIIELGISLGAPLANTWSCYLDLDKPCGTCESCVLRMLGFSSAGITDPALEP